MTLFLALNIAMLEQSGVLTTEQRLELEKIEVEYYLEMEQKYLDARPIHEKLVDGDDLSAFSPRVIHSLERWSILPRGSRR